MRQYCFPVKATDALQKTGNNWKQSYRHQRLSTYAKIGKSAFDVIPITAGTLVQSSVNDDVAIQWEWLKFDPRKIQTP